MRLLPDAIPLQKGLRLLLLVILDQHSAEPNSIELVVFPLQQFCENGLLFIILLLVLCDDRIVDGLLLLVHRD